MGLAFLFFLMFGPVLIGCGIGEVLIHYGYPTWGWTVGITAAVIQGGIYVAINRSYSRAVRRG